MITYFRLLDNICPAHKYIDSINVYLKQQIQQVQNYVNMSFSVHALYEFPVCITVTGLLNWLF